MRESMSLTFIRRALPIVAAFLVTGTAIAAETVEIKDCKVTFSTLGRPVLVKIEGKSEIPCKGSLEISDDGKVSGKLSMELTKIDTGIGLRNKHLRENYLQTDQFPVAELNQISPENLKTQLDQGSNERQKFAAKLKLHGVEAPITAGTYTIQRGSKGRTLSASFRVDLPDHGVQRPSFMGVEVVDAVEIDVKFKF